MSEREGFFVTCGVMENKSVRERRVLCYLWCYGKQVSEREGFFVTCGVMENKSVGESRVLCYLWCCLVCTLYELETSSALNKTIKSKSVFLNCKVLF